jgi:predicted TIM-barrel fold metal-dependent hydrolase
MDRLLLVSADGHATMPEELWPDYLEKRYHEYLPRLSGENAVYTRAMGLLNDVMLAPADADGDPYDVFDTEQRYRDRGWAGAWDLDVRLAEMDREGVAAEFVFNGYLRATDLFFNVSNTDYPVDVVQAGVRAYDRWAADTFGPAGERLLLVGPVDHCLDLDATLREAKWTADHGFTGTYMPGFTAHAEHPPLYDEHWEPLWSFYEETGMALVVHAGWGFEQGFSFGAVQKAYDHAEASGGSDEDLIEALMSGLFNDKGFFADLKCRRVMWQLMLGGVFDRHPDLRVMMTEVRGDWIPSMLTHLDGIYEARRAELPARRKPSEYWHSNFMAGLSFMHRAEIDMRDEIGVETLAFGRDYPHTESTWPNTKEYLGLLFEGVPTEDVRKILGENLASFLDLDRSRLAPIVERVGFRPDDLGAGGPVDAGLVEHINRRTGYDKQPEGASRLPEIGTMIEEDLTPLTAGAGR